MDAIMSRCGVTSFRRPTSDLCRENRVSRSSSVGLVKIWICRSSIRSSKAVSVGK
jgi:hypothetical protein